ncbi:MULTISPECIES: hypothetical protein, partial [Neisseria]
MKYSTVRKKLNFDSDMHELACITHYLQNTTSPVAELYKSVSITYLQNHLNLLTQGSDSFQLEWDIPFPPP